MYIVLYSYTVQYSTVYFVQYSTVLCTVQYCTVLYSTVHHHRLLRFSYIIGTVSHAVYCNILKVAVDIFTFKIDFLFGSPNVSEPVIVVSLKNNVYKFLNMPFSV